MQAGMDGASFAKLCRETGLLGGKLNSIAVDIAFSKAKAKVCNASAVSADIHTHICILVGRHARVQGRSIRTLSAPHPKRQHEPQAQPGAAMYALSQLTLSSL